MRKIVATVGLTAALALTPAAAQAAQTTPRTARVTGVSCNIWKAQCGWKFNRPQSVRVWRAAQHGSAATAAGICALVLPPVVNIACGMFGAVLDEYVTGHKLNGRCVRANWKPFDVRRATLEVVKCR
jgi:hypothetical protein